jgi:hypothetical protein
VTNTVALAAYSHALNAEEVSPKIIAVPFSALIFQQYFPVHCYSALLAGK